MSDSSSVTTGTKIGPYEILGWLGAGGMGVVYRARDSRLGRDVAIKVIPESFAADASRLQRFQQEARAAGQLNHPNILAVYDIGVQSGAPYIVAELLEGESLRSRLEGGPLPVRKAVDYARQTAAGLAAAHDKGIVHRDVKPDNLFITNDGRVKILDFGIAKLTRPSDDTQTGMATQTAEDVVVGTAGYMSPEQVRGEPVDARSDIFSVGAVLYEMLTGRPPFSRATAADTMAAILKEDPGEPLPAGVPPALDRIVSRCLEKTRETRYQSARDLAFGLEVLSDTSASPLPPFARPTPGPWRMWLGAGIVAAGAVAAAVFWLTGRVTPPFENPLANAQFSRITDWPGTEAGAQISPDGKFVAFLADRDGKMDLFVDQIDTGGPVNFTKDLPGLMNPTTVMNYLGFSGDSGEVWFTERGEGDASAPKWKIPVTGGTPRPFLGHSGTSVDRGATAPSWSSDDKQLVYFNNVDGDPLYLANRTAGDPHRIEVDTKGFFAKGQHNHNPVWSQDGQWIYFAHGGDPLEGMSIWRVRPSGGTPEQLTAPRVGTNILAPISPRTILFVARHEDGSGPWLWSLDLQTKVTGRVTSGLERFSTVSASRDGRRVVATVTNPIASLWQVPILDRLAEDRDVQSYSVPNTRAFAPRFGKESLFYLSARGGGDGLWLWRFKEPQATEIWKPANDSMTEPPAVSRDGRRVAVVARQEGKRRLLVMTADGTNTQTLAPSIEIRGAAGSGSVDWSPDDSWIVVAGSDAQGAGLFKIPLDGSEPVRLASGAVVNPICSPDGTLIVYGGPVVGGRVPILGVRPDRTKVDLPNVMARLGGGYRFLSNSKIVYLERGQSTDFTLLDLA
ncbi:MAG TPA: LpqB family beta-propeller domain-containing protein, partial [Vicinamibacterales bacterium]